MPAAAAAPTAATAATRPAEPADATAGGFTSEQLTAWRAKFNEKLAKFDKARKLIAPAKEELIRSLLKNWDSMDRKERDRLSNGNADYWKRTYIVNGADDSLINGGKRVVNTDKIFDELKLIHTENQHIKGKLLYKKVLVQPKLHGITKQHSRCTTRLPLCRPTTQEPGLQNTSIWVFCNPAMAQMCSAIPPIPVGSRAATAAAEDAVGAVSVRANARG